MQTISDKYEVLGELGAGGISTVYKVRDLESGETLALKRIEPARTSDEELIRFHREFRFLSQIDHPHIVRVYDTGTDGTLPYFTMEYLEGQTLAEILNEPDKGYALTLRRDTSELLNFLKQTCSALSHIHEQGTVHRDLKPSNLMVLPNGSVPHLKVLDLGLAKFRDNDPGMNTRSAQMLGTVHYSAPEQIKGLNVDGRTDLYSLGAILYEIMTGRRPFTGDNPVSVAMQHLNELPVPPRVHDLDVPHHLQLLIMKMLEKDPDRRYRSPEDLILDISDPDIIQVSEEAAPAAPPLLLNPRFLGRREPAAQTRTIMSNLRSGKGCLLAVSGSPGIGKTRFLNEIGADARVMGIQVLAGTCYRENPSPYGPIISAIREGLGERSLWNWVDRDDRFSLARLFPELIDEAIEAIPEQHQMVKPETIIDALAKLLEAASRSKPIIVSIDDLQWADDATLGFLSEMTGRVTDLPISILAGHRPYESERPEFLETAEAIALGPLNRDHTRELIGSVLGSLDVPEDLTNEIFSVSAGNPFTVIEAIRGLEDSGTLIWKRNQWHYSGLGNDLPDRIEWLVNQRLGKLSERRREILEFAAILGRPFSFDFLTRAEIGEESEIRVDLLWLRSHNLVKEDNEGRYLLFHANVEDAVSGSLSQDRERELHRRIAETLAEETAPNPEEVGRHYLDADEVELAVPFVLEAARIAERRCSYLESYRVLKDTEGRLLHLAVSHEIVGNVTIELARVCTLLGKSDESEYLARQLEGMALDRITKARALLLKPYLGQQESQKLAYAESLNVALDFAERNSSFGLALNCAIRLMQVYSSLRDTHKADQVLDRAQRICSRKNDQFHKAFLLYLQGNHAFDRFRLVESRSSFVEAAELFKRVGHERLFSISMRQLAEVEYYRGNLEDSTTILDNITATPSLEVECGRRYIRALVSLCQGTPTEAIEAIDGSYPVPDSQSSTSCLLAALKGLAYAKCQQRSEATRSMRQAIAALDQFPSKRAQVLRIRGQICQAFGELPDAVHTLETSLELSEGDSIQSAQTKIALGETHRLLGNFKEARKLLESANEFLKGSGARLLIDQVEEEIQHIPMVHTMAEASNSPANLNELVGEITRNIVRCTGAERAILALFSDSRTEPELLGTSDQQVEDASEISNSILWSTIQNGVTLVTHDASSDSRFAENASITTLGVKSIVCIPISTDNAKTAALYVDHRGVDYFSERDVVYLQSFADLAGMAIDRSSKYDLLRQEVKHLAGFRTDYANVIGSSPGMQSIYEMLDRVCQTDIPVLLLGETGTGKGLIARTIHEESNRSGAPFLTQNCGALNLELLESELFGHGKGAFTGADTERKGLFEAANGGTIFLDEIGDAPLAVQVRLLQVIEEGFVRRVGENENRLVDTRVIAATNRDLEKAVNEGDFREDLYYRLKVVPITIPALRDRREDIVSLANHFLETSIADFGWSSAALSREVLAAFERYHWPGNIRELVNEVRRGLTLAGNNNTIELTHLSERVSEDRTASEGVSTGSTLKETVLEFERSLVLRTLQNNDGNITRSAETLGMSRVGLQRKIKRLGLGR